MVDVKKRTLEDDHEMGIAKKRALSSPTDSPIAVNGKLEVSHEDPNEINLEKFRKEAIYRRMKQYSREYERAQEQIVLIEKRRDTLQANLAIISACWLQLIQEVRTLIKPPSNHDALKQEVFESSIPDFLSTSEQGTVSDFLSESLKDRSKATLELISTLLTSTEKYSPDAEDLRRQCSSLQQEVSILRANLAISNQRLTDMESDKDRYHMKLLSAEARADRGQHGSSQAQRMSTPPSEKSEKKHVVKEEPKTEDNAIALTSLAVSEAEHDQVNGHSSPIIRSEYQTWKDLYESHCKQNTALLEELQQLKLRCGVLETDLACPSLETLQRSPLYEALLSRLQAFQGERDALREQYVEIQASLRQLHEEREDFKEKLIADYNVRYDEQKNLLVKRDHENIRLREQRDALQGELAELKAKMAERRSTSQFKILLQSQSDHIAALELECRRLKSELAANAGDSNLFELVLGDRLSDLPERLQNTERKLEALESSLTALNSVHPDIAMHIRGEADAKESLSAALSRLERFESIFGPEATLPPDQRTLIQQLREKEEQLHISRLKHKQEEEASNALFGEIEKLSAAWEGLDRQNKSKVFEMDSMEAKLQKLAAEKAKADNKYFGAMRQKEAAEAERKASTRALEKLQKTVERYIEGERAFALKLTGQEKEITLQKKRSDLLEERCANLERQHQEETWRHENDQKLLAELKRQLSDVLVQEKHHRAEARRLEDECFRAQKELERATAKTAISFGRSSSHESELEEKYEKCMKLLRCSTCKQSLRTHVLTKCMHTFCKGCVQARIDTRQRKCPACNMGFSHGEFQQLYFQG